MAANHPKFMFETSFDPETPEQAAERAAQERAAAEAEQGADDAAQDEKTEHAPEEPPEPTYSEAEIQAERQKAHKEGKQAGSEDAWFQFRTQTDQMAVKALKVLGDQIKDLFDAQEKASKTAYDDAMQVAVAMTRKMLPELARRGAIEEVTAVLRDCLALVVDEPQIVVTVHDGIADDMEARLTAVVEDSDFGGRVVLQTDATLERSDVRVQWNTGGADRNTNRLWDEIDDAVVKGLDIETLPQRDLPAEKLTRAFAGAASSERDALAAADKAADASDTLEDGGFDPVLAGAEGGVDAPPPQPPAT